AYDRSATMKKQNPTLIADEQVEQLKTALDVNKAVLEAGKHAVDQATASLNDAKSSLAKTTIYAPMSGRVTRLAVEQGETAVPGTFNKDAATLPDFSATAKVITDKRTNVLAVPIIALTVRENQAVQSGDTAVGLGKAKPAKEIGKKDVEGVFVVGSDNKVTFRAVKVGIAGEK